MLLRQVKGRMDAHRGRVILIQTQLLKHIGEIETQGMGTIAEIQPSTLETLKVREAKEGQLSPKTKHNEAITILFKPGIEGNVYGIEGAIRKWVGHNGITGVRWKGTNGEESSQFRRAVRNAGEEDSKMDSVWKRSIPMEGGTGRQRDKDARITLEPVRPAI